MARPKITYAGLRITDQYLTVHFSAEIAHAVRFCEVKVPLSEVAQPEINDAVQRHLNRQMHALFFPGEETAPLW